MYLPRHKKYEGIDSGFISVGRNESEFLPALLTHPDIRTSECIRVES